MIGDSSPMPELVIEFISHSKHLKATTRSRILYTLKGFYKYSGLPPIPLKIREPKRLPQYVEREDIEKLINVLKKEKP